MTDAFWDSVLLFKSLYEQALDPVAQQWSLTRMELDLLLFLSNNPAHNTAADSIRLRKWSKSHVSAAVRALTEKGLLSAAHPEGNRKTLRLTPLPAADRIVRQGQMAQHSFYEALLNGISPDERQTLTRLFEKIARNVRAAMEKR